MHFEVLAEDKSGSIALDILLAKILGANGADHSWKLHPYKGIGRIPKNLQVAPNPGMQFLLHHLPALLRGYGQSLPTAHACVEPEPIVEFPGVSGRSEKSCRHLSRWFE